MKNIFIMLGLLMTAGLSSAWGAIQTIEEPIVYYQAPESVSVSTSAFTNVTSTTTRMRFLSAILIDNPSSNSAKMYGHLGDCTSTSVATSVLGPVEIAPGSNGGFIRLAEDVCLWLISLHTSAENVTVQGVKQNPRSN